MVSHETCNKHTNAVVVFLKLPNLNILRFEVYLNTVY